MSRQRSRARVEEDEAPVEEEAPEAEEDDSFIRVSKLEECGIASSDIKKLEAAGYHTVHRVATVTLRVLSQVKGISEAKAERIQAEAQKYVEMGLVSASDKAIARAKTVFKVTTGSAELDKLLEGGVESHSITEIFGEARSGKSQLCFTLCVTAQLPTHMGGGEGRVLYIDTENSFRPERIREIAQRYQMNEEWVLENVIVGSALNTEQQQKYLRDAAKSMSEKKYSMIIIDSVTALFRSEYVGRAELAPRQAALNKCMSELQRLSVEFGVAVVITNQVVAQVDGANPFTSDPKKPIGGNIISHSSQTRLSLRKGKGETRVCKIFDSPSLAEAEATFALSKEGVRDAT